MASFWESIPILSDVTGEQNALRRWMMQAADPRGTAPSAAQIATDRAMGQAENAQRSMALAARPGTQAMAQRTAMQNIGRLQSDIGAAGAQARAAEGAQARGQLANYLAAVPNAAEQAMNFLGTTLPKAAQMFAPGGGAAGGAAAGGGMFPGAAKAAEASQRLLGGELPPGQPPPQFNQPQAGGSTGSPLAGFLGGGFQPKDLVRGGLRFGVSQIPGVGGLLSGMV